MKVVLVNPGEAAEIADIDKSLVNMQAVVGGLIEAYYPFSDEVCIVCNEEGKYNGMEPNRAIYVDGELADIVFGPFFVCGLTEDDFGDLTDEQAEEYYRLFEHPESFSMEMGQIKVGTLQ